MRHGGTKVVTTSSNADAEKIWVLSNRVAQRIEIQSDDSSARIRIPPFGHVDMTGAEIKRYSLTEWVSTGILETTPMEESELGPLATVFLIWGVVFGYGGVIWLIWTFIVGGIFKSFPPNDWWLWCSYLATTASLVFLFWHFRRRGAFKSVSQKLRHRIGGLLQLGIAFGIPLAVIGAGQYSVSNGIYTDEFGFDLNVTQVGPAVQVLLLGILSGLPALLFYLFDRQKLTTLREEFYRSVLLLVPSIHTLSDAESVFGLRVQGVLGKTSLVRAGRFLPHNRSIILVTTIIVTIGWVSTLANEPIKTGWPLSQYFIPASEPMVYAFLGAYTYGIGMLFRRYTRSDIKPSAYAHFTVRTISAIIIAWAFTLTLPSGTNPSFVLVVAFVIGFFPDTGLMAIFEFVRNRNFIKTSIPSIAEKYPLERLDGINIYHRARLIDEGIENIENLAHADLVDLMLETRIPLATLIDWIDQSILFLHVGTKEESEESDLAKLREYGIRTASDLEKVRDAAKKRGTNDLRKFLSVLNPGDRVRRIETVLDALKDDEWMDNIRIWRKARYPKSVLRDPSNLG